ncbi:Hypothetical protein ORPV_483 [Orpheovirus IHUMI-LCC2]|uniref:Uncharacterized protein n=1 Tax=Orpheovirus IHUMI-LCC2 TaxID=2023057 RepID=A0A2I2L4D7_9VIRU|nr:Hypothetical protein ORPV_483 [Orpheovirus IHUMI-LCC2]SNW62387.1 Hypothetical protein ORPV_483 [Orpheovirus IHUMI-LCC2]
MTTKEILERQRYGLFEVRDIKLLEAKGYHIVSDFNLKSDNGMFVRARIPDGLHRIDLDNDPDIITYQVVPHFN